jgi:hypothetical protein
METEVWLRIPQSKRLIVKFRHARENGDGSTEAALYAKFTHPIPWSVFVGAVSRQYTTVISATIIASITASAVHRAVLVVS